MRIIPFKDSYRDDMIFMVLEAKNALGRIPHLNEDLLNIRHSFLERGDRFWIALDEKERVIGCIGYHIVDERTARLQRLYVKSTMKRQGIGSELLKTAENDLRDRGVQIAMVHLGDDDYWESKLFYPAKGYEEYQPSYMRKEL